MEKIVIDSLTRSIKIKIAEEELQDECYEPCRKRRMDLEEDDNVDYQFGVLTNVLANSLKKSQKARGPKRVRNKQWWTDVYQNYSQEDFKKHLRIEKATFNMILGIIRPYTEKQPTNIIPKPISSARQLGLSLYRLGHGVTYSTLSQLFGVS